MTTTAEATRRCRRTVGNGPRRRRRRTGEAGKKAGTVPHRRRNDPGWTADIVRCANIGVFIWNPYGLGRYDFRAAAFVDDAHGRGYIYVQVAVNPGTADDSAARGVDLRLKDISPRTAGVRFRTPHERRRTFITTLPNEGDAIAVASRMAGHRNIATTARYNRCDERTNQDAAAIHIPYQAPRAERFRRCGRGRKHRPATPRGITDQANTLANTNPGGVLSRGHRNSIAFTLSAERPERPATSPIYPRAAAGGAG